MNGRFPDDRWTLTKEPGDERWEQNIVLLRVHINVWAAAAAYVGLLQFKAVGVNPPEFYTNLQWLTLLVAAFGTYIAFQHSFLGWAILFFSLALLSNPVLAFVQSRSTWFFLNIAFGIALIAAAVLLRWNTQNPWITRPRDIANKSVEVAFFTAWVGVFLHIGVNLALVPLSYLLLGDEQLGHAWIGWRDENWSLVGLGTASLVCLPPC